MWLSRSNLEQEQDDEEREEEEEEGGGEEEGFFKAKSMNEVDAGRERATRHRLDMMTTSLFLPISLHVTVREPLGPLTDTDNAWSAQM